MNIKSKKVTINEISSNLVLLWKIGNSCGYKKKGLKEKSEERNREMITRYQHVIVINN